MATRTLMTAEQFDQLPEEGRHYELLDAERIEPPSATPGIRRLTTTDRLDSPLLADGSIALSDLFASL